MDKKKNYMGIDEIVIGEKTFGVRGVCTPKDILNNRPTKICPRCQRRTLINLQEKNDGVCSECMLTIKRDQLFELTDKHDSWEDLIEMLTLSELNRLIEDMKERNDILEE